MKLYIARDKNEDLYLYECKPKKNEEFGMFFKNTGKIYNIDDSLFPEITWENSPQQVELKLIEE